MSSHYKTNGGKSNMASSELTKLQQLIFTLNIEIIHVKFENDKRKIAKTICDPSEIDKLLSTQYQLQYSDSIKDDQHKTLLNEYREQKFSDTIFIIGKKRVKFEINRVFLSQLL